MAPKNLVFESLRGLAALAVCLLHLSNVGIGPIPIHPAVLGGLGVNLFFVLSGFLIARCVLAPTEFALGKYLTQRCRRLLPAYFASLVLLTTVMDARHILGPAFGQDLLWHATLLHGWTEDYAITINAPYWTLSHEWSFYIFMGLAAPMLRGKAFAAIVGLMFAVALTCRFLLHREILHLPRTYQHPFCYLDHFACGMLAAKSALHSRAAVMMSQKKWLWLLCLLGVSLTTWALWRYGTAMREIPAAKLATLRGAEHTYRAIHESRTLSVTQPLVLALGFATLASLFWLKPANLSRWLRFTPLPWMGKVSYSTYIWHMPILLGLTRHKSAFPDAWVHHPWLGFLGAMAVIYLLSYISYRGFEAPFYKPSQTSPGSGGRGS